MHAPGAMTGAAAPSQKTTPSASDSAAPGKESGPGCHTFVILALGAAGMACLMALLPAAGHDQLWFLLLAERWLHGAQLYGPELFDSNTPATIWLSAIPVTTAEAMHLSPSFVGKVLFVMLEATVAALSLRILRRLGTAFTRSDYAFLAFSFITLFAVVPARDFGQRDLLTAMLCLPYVLAAALAPDPSQTWLRAAIALLAAVGVCVKPQLALVPLTIELSMLVRRGWQSLSKRPEPWILAAAGLLFAGMVQHFAPLYFSQALPTVFSTYWAIGHLSAAQLVAQAPQLHLLAILAIAFFLRRRSRPHPLHPAITALLIAGSAGTLSYYLQGTGWYYQQLPGITLFGCALALEIVSALGSAEMRIPQWSPVAAGALTLLALVLTWHFSGYPFNREAFSPDDTYAISSPDPSFFRDLRPGTAVATITTSVDDAIMPVFRYQLAWSQRTNNLWMLPAILRNETRGGWPVPARHRLSGPRLAALEALQRRWMVEDLTRWHPSLVLVARCQSAAVQCQELEDRHDNLLAFFLADPSFRQIWQRYRFVRSAGDYDAYMLTDQ
jgi:hypothetical protein